MSEPQITQMALMTQINNKKNQWDQWNLCNLWTLEIATKARQYKAQRYTKIKILATDKHGQHG